MDLAAMMSLSRSFLYPPLDRPARHMRSTTFLLASTLTLAACGSSDQSRSSSTGVTAAAGGTLIVPILGDAVDVFPPYVGDLYGRVVQDQVFDRLAEIDSALNTRSDKT